MSQDIKTLSEVQAEHAQKQSQLLTKVENELLKVEPDVMKARDLVIASRVELQAIIQNQRFYK